MPPAWVLPRPPPRPRRWPRHAQQQQRRQQQEVQPSRLICLPCHPLPTRVCHRPTSLSAFSSASALAVTPWRQTALAPGEVLRLRCARASHPRQCQSLLRMCPHHFGDAVRTSHTTGTCTRGRASLAPIPHSPSCPPSDRASIPPPWFARAALLAPHGLKFASFRFRFDRVCTTFGPQASLGRGWCGLAVVDSGRASVPPAYDGGCSSGAERRVPRRSSLGHGRHLFGRVSQ